MDESSHYAIQRWKTCLRLVHFITESISQPLPSTQFVSKYDLVQLIPSRAPIIADALTEFAAFSIADTNYDGVVDTSDLMQYTESWVDNEPVADVSGNGEVDEADWSTYVEAYINN